MSRFPTNAAKFFYIFPMPTVEIIAISDNTKSGKIICTKMIQTRASSYTAFPSNKVGDREK